MQHVSKRHDVVFKGIQERMVHAKRAKQLTNAKEVASDQQVLRDLQAWYPECYER
jgi:hypothetical protein